MNDLSRKEFLGAMAGALSFALLSTRAHAAPTESPVIEDDITIDDLRSAAKVAGIPMTDAQLQSVMKDVKDSIQSYAGLRQKTNDNTLAPATIFRTATTPPSGTNRKPKLSTAKIALPAKTEDLAFLPVTDLARLIRDRKVTSTQLTKLYLERLKTYGPKLKCVITITEELALRQAAQADKEIQAGKYRGPLHGIPYGLKDLFAVKGYPTTWGAEPTKNQTIDTDCAVYEKLTAAGAVLVAKLSMGALAEGDHWFGGRTESPWNAEIGSSGSSAGSGSATAAGLVGFSIGTETSGSIVSPSHNCRVTGLRPTFGSISRYGAMALSWTMDKVGPICRSAADCELVFAALIGQDSRDPSSVARTYRAATKPISLANLKIAIFAPPNVRINMGAPFYSHLRDLGAELSTVDLPAPGDAGYFTLVAEAAAAFEDLTHKPELDTLKGTSWPGTFRAGRFIPAVDFVNADRSRRTLMNEMEEAFRELDVIVFANQGYERVYAFNLTGHPCINLPLPMAEGKPQSVSLVGKLYGEATLLAVAKRLQSKTSFHLEKPDLTQWA